MSKQKPVLSIDGKFVYSYLWAHPVVSADGSRHLEVWQVEGFDVDHCLKRLQENMPQIPKSKWHLIEMLDPEHDVGRIGKKLPLFPAVVIGSNKLQ